MVVGLVAMLLVLMATIAVTAVAKGKDGVLTSAVCAAMATTVTSVLLGGLHRHREDKHPAQPEQKGGE